MQMPSRGRFEWNFNTIALVVGFATQLLALGITIGIFKNQQEATDLKFTSWITMHDGQHRDQIGDTRERDGRTEERFRSIEADTRKIENLDYRLTVQEQTTLTQTKVIEELKTAINTIASDVRVIKEISLRNDSAAGKSN